MQRSGSSTMIPVDPFDKRARPDPYPIYQYMRTVEPVHRSPIGFWILTRYDDCRAVLEDKRWSHDGDQLLEPTRGPGDPVDPLVRLIRASIAFQDPPDHSRHRRRLESVLRPGMKGIGPQAEAAAGGLIDLMAESKGSADLMHAYAVPLSLYVLADLVGLPAADRGQVHRWSREIAGGLDPGVRAAGVIRAGAAAMAVVEYLHDRLDSATAGHSTGLIAALAAGPSKLSSWEVIADLTMVLVTGIEVTSALIGNAALALLKNPDEMARLRSHPALMETALEELIRFDSPIHLTARVATEEIAIGKADIAKGEQALVLLGAANRDPARFTDPDQLHLARADNPHLGFGGGAHECFASALGRTLGRVAIGTLLARLHDLELDGEPEWTNTVTLRSLTKLPVKFAS